MQVQIFKQNETTMSTYASEGIFNTPLPLVVQRFSTPVPFLFSFFQLPSSTEMLPQPCELKHKAMANCSNRPKWAWHNPHQLDNPFHPWYIYVMFVTLPEPQSQTHC